MKESKKERDYSGMYNDDPVVEKRYSKYWNLFLDFQSRRNQVVRFLSKGGVDRNILNAINDSVDRMNEYHLKPAWKEDWQNNVFDPITRNKVITVLSMIAAARLKPEVLVKPNSIFNVRNTAMLKSVLNDLLESANLKNEDAAQIVWEMYTMLSEGIVVGYESWHKGTRKVKYIKDIDPETGEHKTEEIKADYWDDVFGEIVPFEEFYPETIWCNPKDFKRKIRRAFWAREMTYPQFIDTFGKFKNAGTVQKAGIYLNDDDFDWGISADIDPENVNVLQYYDAMEDIMGIWANGVEIYYGPLPWNHKEIPFWVAIGEPIHHQFLVGKSLPDKLMGFQDMNNATFNGMLDQIIIGLNSPVFASGLQEQLEGGYMEPGKVIEMEIGGKVDTPNLGNVSQATFMMLDLLKKGMEESSTSNQVQGIPSGGRKTKYEVQQLQQGAMQIAGLALQMFEHGTPRKYWLRLYNLIQYYSAPNQTKSGKKKYKFIELEDRKLTNGQTGKRMIQIVNGQNDMMNKKDLAAIAEQVEGKPFDPTKSKVEPIVITRDELMNKELELDVNIIPNSSVKMSEIDKKNKDIAFYQATAGNPQFDQVKNAKDFARAFDKPEDIVNENPQQPQGEEGGLPGLPGMKGQGAPEINMGEDLL